MENTAADSLKIGRPGSNRSGRSSSGSTNVGMYVQCDRERILIIKGDMHGLLYFDTNGISNPKPSKMQVAGHAGVLLMLVFMPASQRIAAAYVCSQVHAALPSSASSSYSCCFEHITHALSCIAQHVLPHTHIHTCGIGDGKVVAFEACLLLHHQHGLLRHAELGRHHCAPRAAATAVAAAAEGNAHVHV